MDFLPEERWHIGMDSFVLPMQALPLAWDGYAILEDRCIRDCSNQFADMANLDIQHLQDADLLQLCNISEEEWQDIAGRVELNGSSRVRLRFGERAYEALLFQMNSTVANVSFGLLLRDCRPVQDDASFLEFFKAVHSSTPDALMITDGEGCILHVNAAFERLTGYELKDAVGHTASLLRSHQHDDAFYDAMWEKLRLQGSWDGSVFSIIPIILKLSQSIKTLWKNWTKLLTGHYFVPFLIAD